MTRAGSTYLLPRPRALSRCRVTLDALDMISFFSFFDFYPSPSCSLCLILGSKLFVRAQAIGDR